MEKIIEGIVYQLVEQPTTARCPCQGCAGLASVRLCSDLGSTCVRKEHETKVWLEKGKSDEG